MTRSNRQPRPLLRTHANSDIQLLAIKINWPNQRLEMEIKAPVRNVTASEGRWGWG
jgi:hypothetical protein